MAKLRIVPPPDPSSESDEQRDFFWYTKRNEYHINRERLHRVSADHGFRYYNEQLYQVIDKFIYKRDAKFYYDEMKAEIEYDDQSQWEKIKSAYETFIQKNGSFIITRLPVIDKDDIICDTRDTCYKFYEDSYVVITKTIIDKRPYSDMRRLAFADKVQPRIFRDGNTGKYIEFLKYACNLDDNFEYVSKLTGYYAHEHNDATMGYFAVLTETCVDPKMGGGSGKNLWTKLFEHITTLCDKPGSQTKFDETTFQTWQHERIFSISDLPKDFDLAFFKNQSTGGILYKKLYSNQTTIPIDQSPKLMFNTNFSYNCTDGGLRRRIIPLEFTDYFTRMEGVDTFFNCHFPTGWTDEDWAGYDGFMAHSIQLWLRCGCKISPKQLSESGWQKQFEFSHGTVVTALIYAYWDRWVELGFIDNDKWKDMINAFYIENSITKRPIANTIHAAIKDYSRHFNVEFDGNSIKRSQNGVVKGKLFSSQLDLPF